MQHRGMRTVLAAGLAALSLGSVAHAATISGTRHGDDLRGSSTADRIWARGGADTVRAFAGDDRVHGNWGADRLRGGLGNDRIWGEHGADLIAGGQGDDRLHGGAAADRIFANRGADRVWGGWGDDDLWALARADVTPGPNGETDTTGDRVHGGPGDDTIHTRDGEVDRVFCGRGNDTALLDNVDKIVGARKQRPNGSCETVVRADPKPGEDAPENAEEPEDAA